MFVMSILKLLVRVLANLRNLSESTILLNEGCLRAVRNF